MRLAFEAFTFVAVNLLSHVSFSCNLTIFLTTTCHEGGEDTRLDTITSHIEEKINGGFYQSEAAQTLTFQRILPGK